MSQKFLPVGVEENKNKNEKRKDPKIQRIEEKILSFSSTLWLLKID